MDISNENLTRSLRTYVCHAHHRRAPHRAVFDPVTYESRLELARLLFADFDRRVNHVIAQPFLFRATVDNKQRKHVPVYLLVTGDGPVVVDVKPAGCLSDPKVMETLDWTRTFVESRG
jgi:hypothetical protein